MGRITGIATIAGIIVLMYGVASVSIDGMLNAINLSGEPLGYLLTLLAGGLFLMATLLMSDYAWEAVQMKA